MTAPEKWLRKDGTVVSCTESVKVLTETWDETEGALQDFFEDAVLLGVAKREWKEKLHALIDSLECDYAEKTAPVEALSKGTAESNAK